MREIKITMEAKDSYYIQNILTSYGLVFTGSSNSLSSNKDTIEREIFFKVDERDIEKSIPEPIKVNLPEGLQI